MVLAGLACPAAPAVTPLFYGCSGNGVRVGVHSALLPLEPRCRDAGSSRFQGAPPPQPTPNVAPEHHRTPLCVDVKVTFTFTFITSPRAHNLLLSIPQEATASTAHLSTPRRPAACPPPSVASSVAAPRTGASGAQGWEAVSGGVGDEEVGLGSQAAMAVVGRGVRGTGWQGGLADVAEMVSGTSG